MLAEILSRMEPVTSERVSQGHTLPDSSHTPLPEQRCHLPGQRGFALPYSHLRVLFGQSLACFEDALVLPETF